MSKSFQIWFCIVMVSLLFLCDTLADGKKLDEAERKAYEEGYAAAEAELKPEIEGAHITGYAKGYEEGREAGLEAARDAHKEPDSLLYSYLFGEEE